MRGMGHWAAAALLAAGLGLAAGCSPSAKDAGEKKEAPVTGAVASGQKETLDGPPPATAPAQTSQAGVDGIVVAQGGAGPDWTLSVYPKNGLQLIRKGEANVLEAPYAAPRAMGRGISQIDGNESLSVSLSSEPCRDPATGAQFPMRASVTVGGEVLTGCAYRRWDNDVLALMPVIDACLDAAGDRTLRVSHGARFGAARTELRLDGGPERRLACTFADGRARIEPASGAPAPGEGKITFLRAPAENPGGECYEADRVTAANGAFLGWLDTDEGC